MSDPQELERELTSTLNRFSAENASNTPDFILAQYLLGCLAAWNQAVQQRETWYGRDARPTGGSGPAPVAPVEAAASSSGWQPIETAGEAQRTGRVILVSDENGTRFFASWCGDVWFDDESGVAVWPCFWFDVPDAPAPPAIKEGP